MALHNLARMTSATTGTGTLTLGSAVFGFLTFANAGVTDGETVTYAIRDGANSEIGSGVYTTAGTTLTRATIYESTNGGAAINCSGSQEVFITVAAENIGYDYICITDTKAQNTQGGGFTSGAWQTRDLNTEQSDDGNLASIASNQITLAAGTYIVRASAPAFRVAAHQIRLQDITNTATLLTGSVELNASGSAAAGTRSHLSGKITLTASTVLEIQHRCGTTKATDGFGAAANFTSEVYTIVELWRENF